MTEIEPEKGNHIPPKLGTDPFVVRNEAAIRGWGKFLGQTLPREIGTYTTGGGGVGVTHYGADVSPGTTAGDVARIGGIDNRRFTSGLLKTAIIFWPGNATPFTDEAEVGWAHTAVNVTQGAYLDLTDGNYHAGGTTEAATLPPINEATLLIIEIDLDKGETRFEQRGR